MFLTVPITQNKKRKQSFKSESVEENVELSEGKNKLLKAFQLMLKQELQKEFNPLNEKVLDLEDILVQSQADTQAIWGKIFEMETRNTKTDGIIDQSIINLLS